MSNINQVHPNFVNYAFEQLKIDAKWDDKNSNYKIDAGELTNSHGVTTTLSPQDKEQVFQKARNLQQDHLIFYPSQADPTLRVYQREASSTNNDDTPTLQISSDELYNIFAEYIQIPAHSCGEKEISEKFKTDLETRGFTTWYDDANERVTCNASSFSSVDANAEVGNLFGVLEGDPNLPSIHLSIHMDRTEPHANPIIPLRDDNLVTSDSSSILGADDTAGIVAILALVDAIQNSNIPHGNIHISGLIAEEAGVHGAFDVAEHNPEYMTGDIGIVFDGDTSDNLYIAAGDIYLFSLEITGSSEHVYKAYKAKNSLLIGAEILNSGWDLGSNSLLLEYSDTVVVITKTESGNLVAGQEELVSSSSVPSVTRFQGQVRSAEADSSEVIAQMQTAVNEICSQEEATCEFEANLVLAGYNWQANQQLVPLIRSGFSYAGGNQPRLQATLGGSNVNPVSPIRGGNITLWPIGASGIHTTQEVLDLEDLSRSITAAYGVVLELSQYKKVEN